MKKFIRSFGFAWQGLENCFAQEQNFRIHIVATICAVAAAIFFHCTNLEWMVIVICISIVIALEMINTAIERFCDLHHPSFDPKVKIIKDVSAGAVLIAAIAAAICGMIIFVPKMILLF